MDIYSRCVNAREPVEEAVETHFPWCKDEVEDLRRLFAAYVDRKGEQSVLDYDDLLLFWHGLLTDRPRRPVHPRPLRLRAGGRVPGHQPAAGRDPADALPGRQEPHGGGRRRPGHLLLPGGHGHATSSTSPGSSPAPRVVTLEQNYRSTQPILDATNEVIAAATERHAKNLWSRRRRRRQAPAGLLRGRGRADRVHHPRRCSSTGRPGWPSSRQAVLFRASHHSLALELELARRNIPFHKYGGLRFVETAHVKDLLAFLRLAENPRDLMAGTRVLMLLPGVGPKKARALMDGWRPARRSARRSRRAARPTPSHRAARAPQPRRRPPGATAPASPPGQTAPRPRRRRPAAWGGLVSLMTGIGSREPGDLASQIKRIRLFYAPLLERLYDNARARLMDLEQLEWLAARFPDRARFLAEIALDPPSYTEDLAGPPLLDEDFLILSTMHSAKGLEWDAVYVIHAADGNIPSDMATGRLEEIEEERRLFYVALTRAKDWLYVCYPLRYYTVSAQLQRRPRLRAAHPLPARGDPAPVRRGPGIHLGVPARPATTAFRRSRDDERSPPRTSGGGSKGCSSRSAPA